MKEKLKESYRFYRLFYNVVSVITLIPILFYTVSISEEPFFQWTGYLKIVQVSFFAVALMIILFAAKKYDLLQTIGIRQIISGKSHRVLSKSGTIKDTGILGIIRHPFYLAVLILLWAGDLSKTTLIVNIILSGYLIIGTLLEERKLEIEFGKEYTEYKKRVSMMFPSKWLKKKFFDRIFE